MPINTRIDGDPDSVHEAATWLRSKLQENVHECVDQVYRARAHAESGWRGTASSGFQQNMTTAGQGADVLDVDTGRLAQSFDAYGDSLHTAQAGMARAKDIARQGGLTVSGDVIGDPGPGPDLQRQVAAYRAAKGEADRANGMVDDAKNFARNLWQEIEGKKYINAADFTNGVAGDLIEVHRSILKQEAKRLAQEAKVAEERYLNSPGGSSLEAKFQEEWRVSKTVGAWKLESEAASVGRRFGSKIPVIGWGISIAGVGYDISQGKPPGKAIFSGVTGTLGAMAVAAAVPGVGWAAAAGLGAGIVIGMGADYAWDHWVPDGAKKAINDGLDAVGNDIADAGKTVGHFFGSIF